MQITENIETGKVYYWKRSKGWDWFGEPRWWEYFVEFTGLNGGGGVWIIEYSKWNSAPYGQWQFPGQPRTLSFEDSRDLILTIESNIFSQSVGNTSREGEESPLPK